MAELKALRKVSNKGTFEKLAKQGQVNDSTFISFRDSSGNAIHKAHIDFRAKNPQYKFRVETDSKNERTIITRLE